MSNTITIRIHKSLAHWLQEKAAAMGVSQGRFVREQLERARRGDKNAKKFMHLAGSVRGGPRDISTRKGYSTK